MVTRLNFNRVIMEQLIEKVTFEQRPEGDEGGSRWISGDTTFCQKEEQRKLQGRSGSGVCREIPRRRVCLSVVS